MHILLVEDDARVARFIANGLKAEGMQCTIAPDGPSGLEHAFMGDQDAIILDRMLPKLDGMTLCQRVRAKGLSTPILMLTAMDDVEDRIAGLRAGADDYLVKPFDFDELLARLESILRRGSAVPNSSEITVGKLSLDVDSRTLSVAGKVIPVTQREFDLLRLLASSAGKYWSRERILNRVWGTTSDPDTNVVDVYIGRLRRKLADDSEADVEIETQRGVGYRLHSTG